MSWVNPSWALRLEDDYFMKQLAKSLDVRPYRLQGSLNKCKSSNFAERRGRYKFKERQLVYMWINHSIPSTDDRNRWNIIRISKHRFLPFTNLNQKFWLKKKLTSMDKKCLKVLEWQQHQQFKRNFQEKLIQEKLFQSGVKVSICTLMSLKPFLINYATERDITLLM